MQSIELRMRADGDRDLAGARLRNFLLRPDLLGVLTPQHRGFVATTIGALAGSAQRDDAAGAGRIDAALLQGERQALLTNMTRRAAKFQNLVP